MKVDVLYKHFAQHKESQWIMKWTNAMKLCKFIAQHPIKRVLDLGTGIGVSAAMVALALKEKGEEYHIDSVEQFDKCIKLANELIPPELKERLTIHKSEVKIWQTEKIPYQYFSIYEKLPEDDYDLIINDGPSPIMEGEQFVDLPNGTVIQMLQEDKLKPGTFIAWDGRYHMIRLVDRYYSDNFYLARANQQGDDLNILERKNNPIVFRDELLDRMKPSTYFNDHEVKSGNK